MYPLSKKGPLRGYFKYGAGAYASYFFAKKFFNSYLAGDHGHHDSHGAHGAAHDLHDHGHSADSHDHSDHGHKATSHDHEGHSKH